MNEYEFIMISIIMTPVGGVPIIIKKLQHYSVDKQEDS